MKGGPTDPPNAGSPELTLLVDRASMKGGPTDPPNKPSPNKSKTGKAQLQ